MTQLRVELRPLHHVTPAAKARDSRGVAWSMISVCPFRLINLKYYEGGWGGGERLFQFDWEEEGVGAYSRLGAYLLFLPLGWALIPGGR